jgi:hypothetical protein
MSSSCSLSLNFCAVSRGQSSSSDDEWWQHYEHGLAGQRVYGHIGTSVYSPSFRVCMGHRPMTARNGTVDLHGESAVGGFVNMQAGVSEGGHQARPQLEKYRTESVARFPVDKRILSR